MARFITRKLGLKNDKQPTGVKDLDQRIFMTATALNSAPFLTSKQPLNNMFPLEQECSLSNVFDLLFSRNRPLHQSEFNPLKCVGFLLKDSPPSNEFIPVKEKASHQSRISSSNKSPQSSEGKSISENPKLILQEAHIVDLDDLLHELNRMDKFHHQIQCLSRVSILNAKKMMRVLNSNFKR
jgi:hypothetical protein